MDKMYRQVFKKAGIAGTSHVFRHTFSVELLKAGVDIHNVSKALGHSSVVVTERYYAKWNKAQQDILDADLSRAWEQPVKKQAVRSTKQVGKRDERGRTLVQLKRKFNKGQVSG